MKAKRSDPIQYFTGFIMGAFFGFLAESILLIFLSLLFNWLGWHSPPYYWSMVLTLIPIPLVLGLITGRAIAGMHLEDY